MIISEILIIINNQSEYKSPMADNLPNNVNLHEDIPGCEDNYYRCVMTTLRISRGWIDLSSTLALMAVAIISALAAGVNTNATLTLKLNIAIAVISGVGAALRILKQFTVDDEAQNRELLRKIVAEYGSIHNA